MKKAAISICALMLAASLSGCGYLFPDSADATPTPAPAQTPAPSATPAADARNPVFVYYENLFEKNGALLSSFKSAAAESGEALALSLEVEELLCSVSLPRLTAGVMYGADGDDTEASGSSTSVLAGSGTMNERSDGSYGFSYDFDDGTSLEGELGEHGLTFSHAGADYGVLVTDAGFLVFSFADGAGRALELNSDALRFAPNITENAARAYPDAASFTLDFSDGALTIG